VKEFLKGCEDKRDKNHRVKCKVWGRLNATFSAQDQMEDMVNSDSDWNFLEQSLDLRDDLQVHVSLHALQRVTGGNTLQLIGIIKKQEVPFFIDTGSTHNFINEKWVKSLGLKTTFINDFSVIVALDKQLRLTGQCPQVQWRFNNISFQADFLVLQSTNFGVLLGMQ